MAYENWDKDTTLEQVKADIRAATVYVPIRGDKEWNRLIDSFTPREQRCDRDGCKWTRWRDEERHADCFSHRRQRGHNHKDAEAVMLLHDSERAEMTGPEEFNAKLKQWIKELHDYWDGEPVKENPIESA